MGKNHFNQKQKLSILKSAEKTTVKDAAKIAGVHYTTVYDWRNHLEVLGEQGFLEYQPPRPGRGIKKNIAEQRRSCFKHLEKQS